jgi:hypothetical protein
VTECYGRYKPTDGSVRPCEERAVLRCRVSGWPHYYPYCELHVNKLRRVAKEEHLRFDVRKLNIQ